MTVSLEDRLRALVGICEWEDQRSTITEAADALAVAPAGFALAQFIKDRAVQEETSTHMAVYFSETDAAMLLHMAERFLSAPVLKAAHDGQDDIQGGSNVSQK